MSNERNRYPLLEIDLDKLQHNLAALFERCQTCNIEISGVVKGFTALPEMVRVFERSGVRFIASSRVDQLRSIRRSGVQTPLMLLRIPMLSELEDVVELTELSLHSELSVLRAMDQEAARQGKRHKVLLMADLGDLREGFWGEAELMEAALEVERRLPHLELAGVGTNLSCYGTVRATPEKMYALTVLAEQVEQAIGRRLEFISGGASTSMHMVLDDSMPERINLLRLGECVALGGIYGCEMPFLAKDVFTLKAEIVECRDKPSYPLGELTVDAFGCAPDFVDRGVRRRALLALGRVDYGDPADLKPRLAGVEVLGASSDHTIVDVEAVKDCVHVGDVLEFDLCYATMTYLTNTNSVHLVFRGGEGSASQ